MAISLILKITKNFANVRNSIADRLKKVKEMSKSGTTPVSAPFKPGKIICHIQCWLKIHAYVIAKIPSCWLRKPVSHRLNLACALINSTQGQNYPIIIISSSPTSLITMYNVKKFLEDSAYATVLLL